MRRSNKGARTVAGPTNFAHHSAEIFDDLMTLPQSSSSLRVYPPSCAGLICSTDVPASSARRLMSGATRILPIYAVLRSQRVSSAVTVSGCSIVDR